MKCNFKTVYFPILLLIFTPLVSFSAFAHGGKMHGEQDNPQELQEDEKIKKLNKLQGKVYE